MLEVVMCCFSPRSLKCRKSHEWAVACDSERGHSRHYLSFPELYTLATGGTTAGLRHEPSDRTHPTWPAVICIWHITEPPQAAGRRLVNSKPSHWRRCCVGHLILYCCVTHQTKCSGLKQQTLSHRSCGSGIDWLSQVALAQGQRLKSNFMGPAVSRGYPGAGFTSKPTSGHSSSQHSLSLQGCLVIDTQLAAPS